MKYLKSFENKGEQKFKVGDYVVVKNINQYYNNYPYDLIEYMKNTVAIAGYVGRHYIHVEYYNVPIKFKDYFDNYNRIDESFPEDDVRFATPEEIEDYKLEKKANKYNI